MGNFFNFIPLEGITTTNLVNGCFIVIAFFFIRTLKKIDKSQDILEQRLNEHSVKISELEKSQAHLIGEHEVYTKKARLHDSN